MGMAQQTEITTIDALLALPEDGMRHELLDGVHVMTPAPNRWHQFVLAELFHQFGGAIRGYPGIEVLTSPADICLGPRTLVQPDLFVVPVPDDPEKYTWKDTPVPYVAVEILSPSTASRDRGVKRQLYLESGVEEYWIVDIDAKLIERWQAGDERPQIVDETLEWELSPGVSGVIDVPSLFERTRGSKG